MHRTGILKILNAAGFDARSGDCTAPAVARSRDAGLAPPLLLLPARDSSASRDPGQSTRETLCFLRQKVLNSQPCCWLSAAFLRTCGQWHKCQSRSASEGAADHAPAGFLLREALAEQQGWDGTADTPQEQQSSLRGCGLTLSRNGQSSPAVFKPRP